MTQTTAATNPVQTPKKGVAALFGTTWITKNLFYFLFLATLIVAYIAYGHWTDNTLRAINKTEQKVKDLQFEYKTIKSEVMKQGEVKQVEEKVKKYDLKQNTELPKTITIPKQ